MSFLSMDMSPVLPIFVVGYMHSGTTLLLQILSRNDQILGSRGETKFFDTLPMLRRKFPTLNDDRTLKECIAFTADLIHSGGTLGNELGRRGLSVKEAYPGTDRLLPRVWEDASSRPRYGAIFRLVFDEMTRMAGRTAWVEKTPTHVHHLDTILQDIPDARIVEIVRDPRDILASKKKRRRDVWHSERYRAERRPLKHLEKGYDPLWDALAWKSAVRAPAAAGAAQPAHFHRLRYEDLVRQPQREVRRICRFLDLEFDPAMLDVSYRISADLNRTGHRQGITDDAVGRWQRVLDEKELALCQLLLRNDLAQLGYEPAPVSSSAWLFVPLLLARSSLEFGQRLYRKGRLAGPGYAWNVLLNYGKRFRQLLHGL